MGKSIYQNRQNLFLSSAELLNYVNIRNFSDPKLASPNSKQLIVSFTRQHPKEVLQNWLNALPHHGVLRGGGDEVRDARQKEHVGVVLHLTQDLIKDAGVVASQHCSHRQLGTRPLVSLVDVAPDVGVPDDDVLQLLHHQRETL